MTLDSVTPHRLALILVYTLNRNTGIACELIKFGCKLDIENIMFATEYGMLAVISEAIKQGFNVNEVDINGNTALMCAACYGHSDIIKILLDHGADTTLKNNDGRTALDVATLNGHQDCISILCSHGLKKLQVNAKSSQVGLFSSNTDSSFKVESVSQNIIEYSRNN